MKVAMFDTHGYDRESFELANDRFHHELTYLEPRLTGETASLAAGHQAVCSFVNDRLDERALATLREVGIRLVALRSAGYNHVDLQAAARLGLPVVRVPEYSPHAVAEHAIGLVLALNRKIHRAYARVREWNFSLDGLVGFDLHGKTVGIVGTGRIGHAAARIFHGFGCRIFAHDLAPDDRLVAELGVRYVDLREADIVSLHVPLTPGTHHMIDSTALAQMKPGALLINTGRGALIDSRALIGALKTGHIGGAGLDVYEEEEGVFFQDLSDKVLKDDILARLLTFPNVLVHGPPGVPDARGAGQHLRSLARQHHRLRERRAAEERSPRRGSDPAVFHHMATASRESLAPATDERSNVGAVGVGPRRNGVRRFPRLAAWTLWARVGVPSAGQNGARAGGARASRALGVTSLR